MPPLSRIAHDKGLVLQYTVYIAKHKHCLPRFWDVLGSISVGSESTLPVTQHEDEEKNPNKNGTYRTTTPRWTARCTCLTCLGRLVGSISRISIMFGAEKRVAFTADRPTPLLQIELSLRQSVDYVQYLYTSWPKGVVPVLDTPLLHRQTGSPWHPLACRWSYSHDAI